MAKKTSNDKEKEEKPVEKSKKDDKKVDSEQKKESEVEKTTEKKKTVEKAEETKKKDETKKKEIELLSKASGDFNIMPKKLNDFLSLLTMHGKYTSIDSSAAQTLFDIINIKLNKSDGSISTIGTNTNKSAITMLTYKNPKKDKNFVINKDKEIKLADTDSVMQFYNRARVFALRKDVVEITVDKDNVKFKSNKKTSTRRNDVTTSSDDIINALRGFLDSFKTEFDTIKIKDEEIKYLKNVAFGDSKSTTCALLVYAEDILDIIKDIGEVKIDAFKFSVEKIDGKLVFKVKLEDSLKNDLIEEEIHAYHVVGKEIQANYSSGVYPVFSNLKGFTTINFVDDYLFIWNATSEHEILVAITPTIEEEEDFENISDLNIDVKKLDEEEEEESDDEEEGKLDENDLEDLKEAMIEAKKDKDSSPVDSVNKDAKTVSKKVKKKSKENKKHKTEDSEEESEEVESTEDSEEDDETDEDSEEDDETGEEDSEDSKDKEDSE